MTSYDDQPHGERRCYLRGCRRDECCQANYRYMSRIRLDHGRGQRRRTTTTKALAHIRSLTAAGWTQAQICRATGLPHRTISAIANGLYKETNRGIEQRILALPIGEAPDDLRDIDATGTRRRLQALAVLGHTSADLSEPIGMHRDALNRIKRGELATVRKTTAEKIARVYRHLSRVPGTSNRIRNLALIHGWHGPLAWDDIDDPAALPDAAEPYTPPAKNGRDSLRMAELEHLLALGESENAIAKQMGASEAYIHDLAVVIRNRQKTDMRKAA
jgi:transcriptional regulator with XRE-family HTH domain